MEFVILFFGLVAVLWKAAIKAEENQENHAEEARSEDPMSAERWAEIVKRQAAEKAQSDLSEEAPERDWSKIAKKNRSADESGIMGSFDRAFSETVRQVEDTVSPLGWKQQAETLRRDLQAAVSGKEEETISETELRKTFLFGNEKKSKRPSPVEIREYHEKRLDEEWEQNEKRNAHERTLNAKRFASARTKQSDAGSVHAVHIDSCEGRLESLRVLYDAGILDRTEYQQRVARVKKQHRESRP